MPRLALVLALSAVAALPIAAPLSAGDGCCPAATKASSAEISVSELKSAIDAKQATVLDCNTAETYAAGHIPGAIHVPTSKEKLAKLLPADKSALIVAYCGGAECGAYQDGVDAAIALGYTNVKHLKAGISGWTKASMPVEKISPQ